MCVSRRGGVRLVVSGGGQLVVAASHYHMNGCSQLFPAGSRIVLTRCPACCRSYHKELPGNTNAFVNTSPQMTR